MAKYLTSNSFDFRDAVDILEATYEGNLPRLELLLHNRALSINFAVDGICSGMTPLHIAACKGFTHIVHWIIHDYKGGKRHMSVRIKESGYTPLHSVIIGQPVDPPPNNPPVTRPGVVALSKEEEKKKRTDVVKELLSTGDTDANAMANFKVTPLHLAAKTGHDEIVKQLLDWEPKDGIYRNQRINLTTVDDTFENTALHLAAGGGYDGVVKELLKYYKRNLVLEIGPTNKMRATPLHVAALQGYFNVVETLLEWGAPVNKTAEGGYTPLHFAVFAVCSQTIAVLLKKAEGLMVSETDWQGLTPIEWAKRLCQTVPNEFTDFTPNERKKKLVNWRQETSDIRDLLEGFDVLGLRKDKQGYMDSANAILVGAALIASITFSSWLQPPLGFQFAMVSTDAADPASTNYVLMEKPAMQGFWVFNSFSFCFATATVVAGANAAWQKRNLSLKDTVAEMRRNVLRASVCLFFAVVGVLGAFACAGFVDLPSGRRYRWYVGAPLLIGGLTCLGFLGAFLKSILDSFPDDIPSLRGITDGVYGVYNLLRWAGMRLGCLSGTDAAQGSGATSSL